LLPLLAVGIDLVAGIRSHRYRQVTFGGEYRSDNFEILVPIYGDARYLTNISYLAQYAERVILCTTSGETAAFYGSLERIATAHGFRIFRSDYVAPSSKGKRKTGGTIRDRVIRDALIDIVTAQYVVCIDADTTTVNPLSELVGELVYRGDDLASIQLVPQEKGPGLVQLQRFEYRLAMRLRFLMPWLVSGACHVGTSEALRAIMKQHSLFFQGNDVETGLLGERLGYKVTHIPFEVPTEVPTNLKSWWRQRLAWAGGEFRLFVMNIRFGIHHPFFWLYGLVVVIALFALRWVAILTPNWALLVAGLLYVGAVFCLHWRHRNWWLLLMPLYTLLTSLVLVPLGIIWYFVMAVPERNFGIIKLNRSMS
jgi:cellulose synthase/poly-beta-1,6-N-acetylglucosamine synthase-like glycosyltransferase